MSSTNATQDSSFTASPQLSDAPITIIFDGELLIAGADDRFQWEPS